MNVDLAAAARHQQAPGPWRVPLVDKLPLQQQQQEEKLDIKFQRQRRGSGAGPPGRAEGLRYVVSTDHLSSPPTPFLTLQLDPCGDRRRGYGHYGKGGVTPPPAVADLPCRNAERLPHGAVPVSHAPSAEAGGKPPSTPPYGGGGRWKIFTYAGTFHFHVGGVSGLPIPGGQILPGCPRSPTPPHTPRGHPLGVPGSSPKQKTQFSKVILTCRSFL
jgi:hypothetical protein